MDFGVKFSFLDPVIVAFWICTLRVSRHAAELQQAHKLCHAAIVAYIYKYIYIYMYIYIYIYIQRCGRRAVSVMAVKKWAAC